MCTRFRLCRWRYASRPAPSEYLYEPGFQVFTGAVPFADITDRAGQLVRHVAAGMRPQRPLEAHALGLTDNVWLTMEKCWQGDPGLRPSISRATEELEGEWLSRSSSGDNGSIQAAQSSE